MPKQLKKAQTTANKAELKNNIIWIKKLKYEPIELQKRAAFEVLGFITGHEGAQKCKMCLQESYFWPNMDEDIFNYTKECL